MFLLLTDTNVQVFLFWLMFFIYFSFYACACFVGVTHWICSSSVETRWYNFRIAILIQVAPSSRRSTWLRNHIVNSLSFVSSRNVLVVRKPQITLRRRVPLLKHRPLRRLPTAFLATLKRLKQMYLSFYVASSATEWHCALFLVLGDTCDRSAARW